MMLLAVKIGTTALVVGILAVLIATIVNHSRIEKLMENVVKGCTVITACTLIPFILTVIWSA